MNEWMNEIMWEVEVMIPTLALMALHMNSLAPNK
jgi:hypothetical protein